MSVLRLSFHTVCPPYPVMPLLRDVRVLISPFCPPVSSYASLRHVRYLDSVCLSPTVVTVLSATLLRTRYGMSGTDYAYAATRHYGVSTPCYYWRTCVRYKCLWPCAAATACPVLTEAIVLQTRYAMCGTELAYAPTGCAVLISRMTLRGVRY
eukprot:3941133-Rhodomonas_salina.1